MDLWVVKASERDHFVQSLVPRRGLGSANLDDQIARLAKLPLGELEKELAKEQPALQRGLRKRVEEARAKGKN